MLLAANQLNELIALEVSRSIDDEALSSLPERQVRCLIYLKNVSEATSGGVASMLGISRSSMSQLLATMEADGLVKRRVNPENRKEILVSLAKGGRALVDRYDQQTRVALERYFDVVTQEEAQQIYEVNRRVVDGLGRFGHPPVDPRRSAGS